MLEEFRFLSGFVIANEKGDEITFDGLDEKWVTENFGPEVFTGASSWDFLEEKKDWFARLAREGKGLVVIGLPFHQAQLGSGKSFVG